MADTREDAVQIEEWSAHIWHVSQHGSIPIGLSGRLQAIANEMRQSAGLEPLGWNDAFPDQRFGECSVHVSDCEGQHTHTQRQFGRQIASR